MKFKTNIKCGACVATVTPVLDRAVGSGNWQVDLSDPLRVLTLTAPVVSGAEIARLLSEVGYTAEEIAIA
jgi:copper chaperone